MALGDTDNPIVIKQGDTRPKIRATAWEGPAKTAIPLTGAAIVFNMRNTASSGTIVVNRQPATIVDAANGVMEYGLTAAQSGTTGTFQAEFEITFSDGSVLTLPSGSSYIWIQIGDDIA